MSKSPPPIEPKRIVEPRILPASLDPDAVKIIRRLRRHGHEAYLVGGCVRDLSLGRIPKDFDVATSARPRQIKRLFRNSRIIGRRFKLVHVQFGDKIIEVSTFRRSPSNEDRAAEAEQPPPRKGRRADDAAADGADGEGAEERDLLIRRDNVFGSAEEDAVRRDFTINGLFYEVEEGVLIDYVDGVRDLKRGVVRTIGDPDIRVQEDPVRILRAMRFAAKLDFRIHPDTWEAILRHHEAILKCAPPRVTEELLRLLSCGAARSTWRLLHESQVLGAVLPEIDAFLRRSPELPGWKTPAADQIVAMFEAVDRIDRGRRVLSNAVLLTVLLSGPIREAALGRQDPAGGVEAIDEVVRGVAARMALPRRDANRIKQILLAQPKLRGEKTPGKKRRRVSRKELVRREYFKDALDFLHVETLALGLPREPLESWTELYYATLRDSDPEAFERARLTAPFGEGPATGPAAEASSSAGDSPAGEPSAEGEEPRKAVETGRRKRRRRRAAGGEDQEAAHETTVQGEADGGRRRRGRSKRRSEPDAPQTGASESAEEEAHKPGARSEESTERSRSGRKGGRRKTSKKKSAQTREGASRRRGLKEGRRGDAQRAGRSDLRGNGAPSRLEFDELRAGPLDPTASPEPEEDEGEDVVVRWEDPLPEIGDPGPISVIQTGIDRTENRNRRRKRKKTASARELKKEVEDQPGLQAFKMVDGDPRGHEVTRPRKKRRSEVEAEERAKNAAAREIPFDPLKDWDMIEDLFGW